jgi:hypothetical protein
VCMCDVFGPFGLRMESPTHMTGLSPSVLRHICLVKNFQNKNVFFILKVCLSNMILRKILSLRFLTKGVFDKHVLVIFQQCFFFF